MKTKLLVVFCVIILLGCASVPIPTPEQNTLVVGKFLVNWQTTGEMSGGNGKYRTGIRVYFQNNQTGKVISTSTQKDGWLLMGKLAAGGLYSITKMFIEQTMGNTVYQMTLNGPFFITIEEGKVNNLGTIQININADGYDHKLIDHDVVKYDFQNDFPDSEWNNYEWKNIFLMYLIDKGK